MKKFIRYAMLSIAIVFAAGNVMTANAMLNEEEQKEALIRRAIRKALDEEDAKEKQTEISIPETEGKKLFETEAKAESDVNNAAEKKQTTETKVKETEAKETETKETETEAKETETEAKETEAEETEAATESEEQDSKEEKIIVAIDPGHQSNDWDHEKTEAIGPDSEKQVSVMSKSGKGIISGMDEYELNLVISEKLKKVLEERGYEVVLTRETNDVDLSRAERSCIANESGAQIYIAIHADGFGSDAGSGAFVQVPSYYSKWFDEAGYYKSSALGFSLINYYCEATGFIRHGIYETDENVTINWSKIPVAIVELGCMANENDDRYLSDAANQDTIAKALADGIDDYFGRS